jgi:hypothetical protein
MTTTIHSTIVPAGYIVTTNETIFGTGATEDAAWANFLDGMKQAGLRVVDELTINSHGDVGEDETLSSLYSIRSATAALIADVEARGGDIGWHSANGVCCTRTEYEEG